MSYFTNSFDGRVVEILKAGGTGFMPSDTIYGLSTKALDEQAVEKIYKIKKRAADKPLIVLIANLEMLDMLSISKNQSELIKKYWPGALTVILEAPDSPGWLHRQSRTLAVRWPDHPGLQELIKKTGPLISTSANFQGHQPISNVQQAYKTFGEELDFYVDVGQLNNQPSTLVNAKLEVIRQGALKIRRQDDF